MAAFDPAPPHDIQGARVVVSLKTSKPKRGGSILSSLKVPLVEAPPKRPKRRGSSNLVWQEYGMQDPGATHSLLLGADEPIAVSKDTLCEAMEMVGKDLQPIKECAEQCF